MIGYNSQFAKSTGSSNILLGKTDENILFENLKNISTKERLDIIHCFCIHCGEIREKCICCGEGA